MKQITQQKIQQLLGWEDQQYSEMQFEVGMAYLEQEVPKWATELSQTKAFWSAFTHQYAIIDEWFLTETRPYIKTWTKLMFRDFYNDFHNKKGKNAPEQDRAYWNSFYDQMLGGALREINQKNKQLISA